MAVILNRIKKRRDALRRLEDIFRNPEHVLVIHYSCETFYDRVDGTSPRITSIAVLTLSSRQAHSFSIHQVAERKGFKIEAIEKHYNKLEKQMLDEFYNFVKVHLDFTWLHWNMRNINYGFPAIAHRYQVLGGDPVHIHENNLEDLSNLFIDIFGPKYIQHPRLPSLIELNHVSKKEFLKGDEEAKAFEQKEYVKLHQSTLRKVDVLATLAGRLADGSIKTNAKIWDVYGISLRGIGEIIKDHWLIALIVFIITIVTAIWGLLK